MTEVMRASKFSLFIITILLATGMSMTAASSQLNTQDSILQDGQIPPPQRLECSKCHVGPEPCSFCHIDLHDEWSRSIHQEENVICQRCHSGAEVVPHGVVEKSTVVCGSCHEEIYRLETEVKFFSSNCEDCHTSHSLTLKDTIPQLCNGCHGEIQRQWASSNHSKVEMGKEVATCNLCHKHPEESEVHRTTESELASCGAEECHSDIYQLKEKYAWHELNCTNCHTHNPNLVTPVPLLCETCHEERYAEWEMGIHGPPGPDDSICTDCHKPHAPQIALLNITLLHPPETPPPPPLSVTSLPLLVVSLAAVMVITVTWTRRGG